MIKPGIQIVNLSFNTRKNKFDYFNPNFPIKVDLKSPMEQS
jgi:hypothetical protein